MMIHKAQACCARVCVCVFETKYLHICSTNPTKYHRSKLKTKQATGRYAIMRLYECVWYKVTVIPNNGDGVNELKKKYGYKFYSSWILRQDCDYVFLCLPFVVIF